MSIWPKASTARSTSLADALLRQVAGEGHRVPADLARGLSGGVAVEVVDHHARAVLGQELRGGAADAARRSGDDRRLAVKYSQLDPAPLSIPLCERGMMTSKRAPAVPPGS